MIRWLSNHHNLYSFGPDLSFRPRFIPILSFNRLGNSVRVMQDSIDKFLLFRNRNPSYNVVQLIRRVNPDVILLDSFFPPNPEWLELNRIKTPKAMVLSDPHHFLTRKLEYAEKNLIDLVFFDCKFAMMHPKTIEWRERNPSISVRWLPHSVDTDVFRDYKIPRRLDVISSGSRNSTVYPLRQKIYHELSKKQDIKFSMPPHARYFINSSKTISKTMIRENYARFLSSAKIFIFGSSIYNYPVMKYTEGMACNTLVMAPEPRDAHDLHFIPGFNFVEINETDFLEKIEYYLRAEGERLKIAKNGFNTARKYHSVEKRGFELVNSLREIMNN
jgi:spore maturation protein CgeB